MSASDVADCMALSSDDDYVASASTQFFLIIMGALVFFMQAGFSLLEAGSIGASAVTSVLFKNLADVVVGAVFFWAVGYGIAYGSADKKFIGTDKFFMNNMGRCEYSAWFFQWTFAATAVTIVSGAMAGRTQLRAYLVYSIALTSFIYPIIVHWTWSGNAWLATGNDNIDGVGYVDFAGSGIVHCTGGVAALVGCYFVGPRGTDVFEHDKADIPGHSMPMVQLGTMILFFGFIGFNGGSVLALDSAADGAIMSLAIVNTVLAAAGGGAAAEIFNWLIVKRKYWSLMQMCNGTIAGMVAVCASANNVYPWAALLIGFIGGIAYKGWSLFIQWLRIDDAIDAVAVHLGAGIWGVIAGAFFANPKAGSGGYSILFNDGIESALPGKQLGWDLIGLLVIITWVGGLCFILFFTLNKMGWLRVSDETINGGLDLMEHGESAYVYSDAPTASRSLIPAQSGSNMLTGAAGELGASHKLTHL